MHCLVTVNSDDKLNDFFKCANLSGFCWEGHIWDDVYPSKWVVLVLIGHSVHTMHVTRPTKKGWSYFYFYILYHVYLLMWIFLCVGCWHYKENCHTQFRWQTGTCVYTKYIKSLTYVCLANSSHLYIMYFPCNPYCIYHIPQ